MYLIAKLAFAVSFCALAMPVSSRWVEEGYLLPSASAANARFGDSVAISGDTIVAGAYRYDSAYVFTRSDSAWTQRDHLWDNNGPYGDWFGYSVAIDADTIVVGAPDDNTAAGVGAGSVYVFTRTGSTWSQQQHLFADDAAGDDQFGRSVAISGDTIVVGAPDDDTIAGVGAGSAYVFTRTGSTWSQQQHLFAADAASDDWFGYTVAIEGDTIVVGATFDETAAGVGAGSAYVFTHTGSTWSQQQHLFAADAASKDWFGRSVAISGDTIVVGAARDDNTAGVNAGSAYVFTRTGSTWSQQQHLFSDDPSAYEDRFGASVAISGDTIVVGVANDDTAAGADAGSAYVFTRTGSTWSQEVNLSSGKAVTGDSFGDSVAVDGDTIVAGAPLDDTAEGAQAGSAYVYGPPFRIFVAAPEMPDER